jgi:hypothetical protein
VTRIILEIVPVPANKEKTHIHSKNTHSRRPYPCKQRKDPYSFKEHSQQTDIIFVVLKATEKARRKAKTSDHKRKTRGNSRRESSSALQTSSVSRSRYDFIPFVSSIQNVIVSVTRTLCEGNLITFTSVPARVTNSRVLLVFAQPGHWLRPMIAKLGPAQKNINKKNRKNMCMHE